MAGPEAPRPAPAAGSKFDLKNIKLSPKQQQTVMLVVVVLGFGGYAYWTYGFKPKQEEFAKVKEELQLKEKAYADAVEVAAKYEEFKQKENKINKNVDFMNNRLPKQSDQAGIIKEITKAATESNIRIVNLIPDTKETKKDSYIETKIALDFDSNFKDLGNFLTRIGYLEQLISPAGLMITAIEKGRSGQPGATIKVNMFIKIYSFAE